MLRHIGNTLPPPYRFRPAADLATEVEWAKNRALTPETYRRSLGEHEPPIPPDLMARVFREYERRKAEGGLADFEDLLRLAISLYETDENALAEVRGRYRAFTVDEYQDVNLLQQRLLELWLGGRDELCAVGDDYQSIYAFTGATPEYLLALPKRFPHARVVRLEANYRSSAQVLELANRLVPRLGGAEKTLRATRPQGPRPALLPFQGAALLQRDAARQLIKALNPKARAVGAAVRGVARDHGWVDDPPDKLGERELTRQADLRRLVLLAEGVDDGGQT